MPHPPPIEWLPDGDPLARYRTLVDLVGLDEGDGEVARARRQMLEDPRLRAVLLGRNLVRGARERRGRNSLLPAR